MKEHDEIAEFLAKRDEAKRLAKYGEPTKHSIPFGGSPHILSRDCPCHPQAHRETWIHRWWLVKLN